MHAFDVIFDRRGAAHIPASLIGHPIGLSTLSLMNVEASRWIVGARLS